MQGSDDPAFSSIGLTTFGSARIGNVEEVYPNIERMVDAGHRASILQLGNGFESDLDASQLLEEVLSAGVKLNHPIHIETHRGTITQDCWRTLQWIKLFPELEFNADLSHWYTGLQLASGDFSAKVSRLDPFFARVRFIHGRIGNSGSIQVSIEVGERDEPHLSHFKLLWAKCMLGASSSGLKQLPFAPELLPAVSRRDDAVFFKDYALERPTANGYGEFADRWDQALKISRLAAEIHRESLRFLTS